MKYEPHSIFSEGIQVQRIQRPEPEAFERDFARPQIPVILTGATENWPCMAKWSNAYLKAQVGHRVVNLSQAKYGVHFDRDRTTIPIFKPLGDFLEMIEAGEVRDGRLYAGNIPIRESAPELWDDIKIPPYFRPELGVPPNVWIGPGGNVVPLHFDFTFNFVTQVCGKKTVLLFPPADYKYLYPFPYGHRSYHFSATNVAAPSLADFPKMGKARCSVVHLEPGEMLFIPLFWWHAVFGYDFNVSLNFWWQATESYPLRHSWQEFGIQYRKMQRHLRNVKNDYFKRTPPREKARP